MRYDLHNKWNIDFWIVNLVIEFIKFSVKNKTYLLCFNKQRGHHIVLVDRFMSSFCNMGFHIRFE
jgi:hypothetical protein